MKKAIIIGYGNVDKIKVIDVEIPQLSQNEVLVKVFASALNPKDILIRKGKFRRFTGNKFPQGVGFDFAGIVEFSNESKFKTGDKVYGMLNGWKGRSCSEYVNVKANELYYLPKQTTFEDGAGIPLAGQTALQAIRKLGKLTSGQKILINGASGGVGTLAIQIAKSLGGVVTSISSDKNTEFCKSLGADHSIAYDKVKLSELKQTFDLFFDVFGNYNYKKVASLLTPSGKYITTVPKPAIFKEQIFNLFRRKKANMVYVKSNSPDLKWLSEKIVAKEIKPVVNKIFGLNEIKAAQQLIESKRAKGKVIIKISAAESNNYNLQKEIE